MSDLKTTYKIDLGIGLPTMFTIDQFWSGSVSEKSGGEKETFFNIRLILTPSSSFRRYVIYKANIPYYSDSHEFRIKIDAAKKEILEITSGLSMMIFEYRKEDKTTLPINEQMMKASEMKQLAYKANNPEPMGLNYKAELLVNAKDKANSGAFFLRTPPLSDELAAELRKDGYVVSVNMDRRGCIVSGNIISWE